MITEEYKGYEINQLYDFQHIPFYNIAKVLDQVWDIAQNYKIVEKDNDRYLETIQIWSKLSTRFKKL